MKSLDLILFSFFPIFFIWGFCVYLPESLEVKKKQSRAIRQLYNWRLRACCPTRESWFRENANVGGWFFFSSILNFLILLIFYDVIFKRLGVDCWFVILSISSFWRLVLMINFFFLSVSSFLSSFFFLMWYHKG